MLAKRNRLVTAADYRSTVRQGRRGRTEHAVLYWRATDATAHARFGFIVAKSVGNAVQRNLVRRRLKNISHSFFLRGTDTHHRESQGLDVVIRPLPGAVQVGWATLEREVLSLLHDIRLLDRDERTSSAPDTLNRTARE